MKEEKVGASSGEAKVKCRVVEDHCNHAEVQA